MKEEFSIQSGFDVENVSDLHIRMKVLAGELFSLWNGLEWLKRQSFVQTAGETQLDMHARQRGLERKLSQMASGILTFSRKSGIWYDIQIPKGTICSTAGKDGVRFVTTENSVLAANKTSVEIPAEAESGGRSGNVAVGTITVLVTPPSGIETVKNSAYFFGGTDEETDEELRQRVQQSYSMISNGTNTEFYRQCALKHNGISSVGIVPRENGKGTVALYLAAKGGIPAQGAINEVQMELDELREINVDIQVKAVTLKTCPVTILLSAQPPGTFEEAKTAAKDAVQQYFDGLSAGQPVIVSHLGKRLLETGIVRNYRFDGLTADKTVSASELAVLGQVIVMQLEGSV